MYDFDVVIRSLGATNRYKGFSQLIDALKICMEVQKYPVQITKDIYPVLARKYCTKPTTIEHNIHTILKVCWETDKEKFSQMAGYKVLLMPSNAVFLDILYYYVRSREAGKVCAAAGNVQK